MLGNTELVSPLVQQSVSDAADALVLSDFFLLHFLLFFGISF